MSAELSRPACDVVYTAIVNDQNRALRSANELRCQFKRHGVRIVSNVRIDCLGRREWIDSNSLVEKGLNESRFSTPESPTSLTMPFGFSSIRCRIVQTILSIKAIPFPKSRAEQTNRAIKEVWFIDARW